MDVGPEDADQRIDNFLVRRLKGVPRSLVYRIVRRGEVRVNSGRVRPTYRLRAGDRVRVPPVRRDVEGGAPYVPSKVLSRLAEAVLYEDEAVLVLDKPAGLAAHGGTGLQFGVMEALRVLRPEDTGLGLAHRLDRATSGCLLLGKSRAAVRRLQRMMRAGEVDKGYLALLAGHWSGGERTVEVPLLTHARERGERTVRADAAGKAASTRFVPRIQYRDAVLVEAYLGTGRTHQIRVHAAHLGHPVAGDERYGDEAFNRTMRARGLKRLFLHAHILSFPPSNGARRVELSAPLPAELRGVLERLEVEAS
ncbi:MAG: RluA family pseudouridine synthase [Gammaproteobacteria bacterium]|nr:RluA family pseudouridine synthase [Gammaproteobacteria bacterium]